MKAVLAALVLIPAISLPVLADTPKKKKQVVLKPATLVVPSSSAGSSVASSTKPAQVETPKPVPAPIYREDVTLEEMHRYHQ